MQSLLQQAIIIFACCNNYCIITHFFYCHSLPCQNKVEYSTLLLIWSARFDFWQPKALFTESLHFGFSVLAQKVIIFTSGTPQFLVPQDPCTKEGCFSLTSSSLPTTLSNHQRYA